MTMAPLLLVAVAAVVPALALVDRTIRDTRVGLVMVLGWYVLESTLPEAVETQVAGFTIGLADVVFVIVLVAAVARLLRMTEIPLPVLLLIAFGLVALLGLARGVLAFGPQSPVVEFRRYLYLVAIALYMACEPPRRETTDRYARILVGWAGLLVAVTLVRWAGLLVGVTGGLLADAGDPRVLASDDALLLLQVGVMVALARRIDPWSWPRWLAPLLLATMLLLQHRTVWVAALVVVGIWAFRHVDLSRAGMAVLTIAVLAGATASFANLRAADLDIDTLQEDLEGTSASLGTFRWRVDGWVALVEQAGPDSGADYLVGEPFGSGWERRQSTGTITVSPHNFYLEAYLRVGLVGLGLLVALFATPLRRLSRARSMRGLLSPEAHVLMLSALPVYCITYAPSPFEGVLVGIAIARAAWGMDGERADDPPLVGASTGPAPSPRQPPGSEWDALDTPR